MFGKKLRALRLAPLVAAVAAGVVAAPSAEAAAYPYERGPAPTNSSIEALRGP